MRVSPESWEEIWSEIADELTRWARDRATREGDATREEQEQAHALSRDMRLVAVLHGTVNPERGTQLLERAHRLLSRPAPSAVEAEDDEEEATVPRRVNPLLQRNASWRGAGRSPPPPAPPSRVVTKRDAGGLRLNWSEASSRKAR